MKYKCTHITKNGLDDYVLHIEESPSFLDRFLHSHNSKVHILYGGNRFWEYSVCGIHVPQKLKDFANEVIEHNG